jgi:hypothetical protein
MILIISPVPEGAVVVIPPVVVDTYKISPVVVENPASPEFLIYPLINIPFDGSLANAKANNPVAPDAAFASVATQAPELL